MVMVSEGDVSRLCVSKEPVRSKVTVSEDMGRRAVRREGVVAVAERRRRREAALLANIIYCYGLLESGFVFVMNTPLFRDSFVPWSVRKIFERDR